MTTRATRHPGQASAGSNSGDPLVLGCAFGYGRDQVRVFVESLRQYYAGPAILLVKSKDSAPLVDYLRKWDVQPAFCDWPLWSFVHIQFGRYVRFKEMLLDAEGRYSQVLLTDVSDVLFQAHPFADAPSGELLCFLEGPGWTIGQSRSNSTWVKLIYGAEGLALLHDKPVSCMGTVLGSSRSVLSYLDLILGHAEPDVLVKLSQYRGYEQGIHNYLLHLGLLPGAVIVPNGQHVFTLGASHDADIVLEPGGPIRTAAGRACPIVHQYNYKPAVLAHVQAMFQRAT